MKIARFLIGGRPTVAVDDGAGFTDYGALLESRGYKSEIAGAEPDRRLIRMLRRGLLDPQFIREQLEWARHSGRNFLLDTGKSAPLLPLRPTKIICMARNWAGHAKEGGHPLPDQPIFFAKTDNCACGPGDPIRIPDGIGRVDHEGELGVVIARRVSRVSAVEAMNSVLGYTIINDVTAREFQRRLAGEGFPWFQAKSLDSFAPLGPWIVTRDAMEPLEGKRIRITVNGELRQDGLLDDLHFKVPQILEAISRHITMIPGDIIATGTPSGVGPIKAGDEVAVEIDGIGRLVNPVAAK